MTGIVVKDASGMYYTGMGRQLSAWDKQLRKAKIYTSYKMARKACNLEEFIDRNPRLVAVKLTEIGDID